MRSVARERAGGSQGRGHITSPSPGLQGPHGQAAWPAGAEVEAAPARRVPVAPLALRDGAPGAVVALEAGVGGYCGGGGVSPFPKGLQALVSALNVACAQNQVLGHGVRGLPGVYRSVPVVPGSVVWCGWGRWGRRSPRHLTAWLEDQDPHLWELA